MRLPRYTNGGSGARTPIRPERLFVAAILIMAEMLGGCGPADSGIEASEDPSLSISDSVRTRVDSLLERARRNLRTRNLGRAMQYADSARRISSEIPEVHLVRGRIEAQRQRAGRAEVAFERVLDLDSSHPEAYLELGHLAFRSGERREALRRYRTTLERAGEERSLQKLGPEVYGQIGNTYMQMGRTDSARTAFRRALELDSTFAVAHGWLSQIYRKEGQVQQALAHGEKALAYDPGNPIFSYLVGFLHLRSGRPKEAVPHLRHVTEEQPWQHGAHYNLGQALLRLGRQEEARRYLARADSLQALQKEIQRLRSQAKNNPRRPEAWERLGDALRRSGRIVAARNAYQTALNLAPGDRELQKKAEQLARSDRGNPRGLPF